MQRLSGFLGRRRVRALVAAATALGLASTLVVNGDPASADPKQAVAATGVGSDTTQDVMNALSGHANGTNYTPAQSSTASGKRQLVSWDAVGSACITPKAPGATINRPNGSTNGRRALSRAIDGGLWGSAGPCGAAGKPVGGLIQYARSSAGPSGTGTALTYIPMGRDGLSFAYAATGVASPVTALTPTQLTSLFSTGPQTINGVNIIPCSIQSGSGTYQSWNTSIGVTAEQMAAATATCGSAVQENDGAGLKAKADANSGSQVIIGFSAANFISQTNGVAGSQLPQPAGTVNLGTITGVGFPYDGPVGGPITANATFYSNGTFGRDVYNVLPRSIVVNPGNNDIKTLFVGPSSAVCAATATINAFGFSPLGAACGSTTLEGPLVS